MSDTKPAGLSDDPRVTEFQQQGYLVLKQMVAAETCAQMREFAQDSLNPLLAPAEFEADVNYPGSPGSRLDQGGDTPRRLLHAYTRHPLYRSWATGPELAQWLNVLMGTPRVMLSQNHHNCIMAKHPGHSSSTHWHQDMRYWRFDRPELLSVWLALGAEHPANGCLQIIPGSHTLNIDRGRFDTELFLREDLPENQALIAQAQNVLLEAGDVLIFHSRSLHCAGQNLSQQIKFSLVFTYHKANNRPISDTRSAKYPDIPLPEV